LDGYDIKADEFYLKPNPDPLGLQGAANAFSAETGGHAEKLIHISRAGDKIEQRLSDKIKRERQSPHKLRAPGILLSHTVRYANRLHAEIGTSRTN